MKQSLANEVMYLKGVGPQRAALLAEREIRTIQDLLGYLPFRYENRLRFASIRELAPGGTYTVQAEVVSGGLVSFARSRNAVYHLMVRDATGVLHCKFFHSGYLEGRFKGRKRIVLHGKVDVDPYRPGRLEMINPQYEFVGDDHLQAPGPVGIDRSEEQTSELQSPCKLLCPLLLGKKKARRDNPRSACAS